jgi:hypothetical protein
MKTELPAASVRAPADALARLALARADLLAATHIERLAELPGAADELVIEVG